MNFQDNNNITKEHGKYDYSIAITRIVGCLMIFLCHYVQITGNPIIAQSSQFFNVGVFVFFLISGYLYGQKNIGRGNVLQWYRKRLIKIFVPLYVVMMIIFLALYIENIKVMPMQYLIYALNLQGFWGEISGAAQLWFLTALMICYFITPLLQFMRDNINKNVLKVIASIFILLQLAVAIMGSTVLALYMMYIGVYIIGYSVLKYVLDEITTGKFAGWSIIMVLAMGLRIAGKILAAETCYYDCIIVLYTQTILAIWIMMVVKFVYQSVHSRLDGKLIRKLDGYTMEIYMVHMMFMYLPFCLVGTVNLVVDTILIILATVISAWILKKAENILTKSVHNVRLKIKKN